MRDELLDREIFTTMEEAKVLINQWRREYNQIRPHSARNYQPLAPEANFNRENEVSSGSVIGVRPLIHYWFITG